MSFGLVLVAIAWYLGLLAILTLPVVVFRYFRRHPVASQILEVFSEILGG